MPTLNLDGLRKQTAARRLERLYLMTGDDVRRIDDAVSLIEATIDPGDQPFALERVYAGDPGGSPIAIADSARALPMLGDRRVVIVMRAERFLKPKRAAKAEEGAAEAEDAAKDGEAAVASDLTPLEKYVEEPVSSATVVFVAADIDRTRRLTKLLLQKAHVLEFSGLDEGKPAERSEARQAAGRQVKEDLQRLGRTIDQKALTALVERAGGDISKLRDDAERLALYTEGQKAISLADVDEVASVATDVEDEWAVVNAIADGDAARALREVDLRLDRGDSVFALVGQIRWWVSMRLSERAPNRVKKALEAILRTDLALKSSGGDPRVLVERLVVELTLT